jgi:hypothetical protein
MSGTHPTNSPRRTGGVVRVEVHAGADRPVHIECHGHAHSYEVAWRDPGDGPVVTDLRVTSSDGAPITRASLRKISPERLARTAAARGGELAFLESMAEEMRADLEEKFGPELEARGIDVSEAVGSLHSWEEPGGVIRGRRKRRMGRPKLTREELERIATWAREAAQEAADDGLAIYPKIKKLAVDSGWRGYTSKHPPSDEAVKGWIRRCKDAGLLAPDAIRKPRTPRSRDLPNGEFPHSSREDG